MPIPKNKKRIAITIPKDWDYRINKVKEQTFGSSMSNSTLFQYLIIKQLFDLGWYTEEQFDEEFKRIFYDK